MPRTSTVDEPTIDHHTIDHHTNEHHTNDLLRACRIGPDDLAANRIGRLGDRQRRHLAHTGQLTLALFTAIGVGFVGLIWALADKPLEPAQWVADTVLLALVALPAFVGWRRMRRGMVDGTVERYEGTVALRLHGRAGWYLHIGDRRWSIGRRARRCAVDGADYRVYVAPLAKLVVAMEPI